MLVAGSGNTQTASFAVRMRGVGVIALVSGVSFIVPTAVVAALVGPELSVVVGSICSLACTARLSMRAERSDVLDARFHMKVDRSQAVGIREALVAWSTFILIFVLLMGTSKLVAPLNAWLAQFSSTVVVYTGADPGSLSFSWVNTPGVLIIVAALAGGRIQGAGAGQMARVFAATVRQMMPTVVTMLAVLGCAKVMGYAGMISSISAFCIQMTGASILWWRRGSAWWAPS